MRVFRQQPPLLGRETHSTGSTSCASETGIGWLGQDEVGDYPRCRRSATNRAPLRRQSHSKARPCSSGTEMEVIAFVSCRRQLPNSASLAGAGGLKTFRIRAPHRKVWLCEIGGQPALCIGDVGRFLSRLYPM